MQYLVKKPREPDMQVEILALLSALSIPDFDFAKLSKTYKFMDWITMKLNGFLENDSELSENDDIILELVKLIGTMSEDVGFLPLVVQYNTIPLLLNLISSMQIKKLLFNLS